MSWMFSWVTDTLSSWGLWSKKARILFLGLDNAGKTTLLHMLRDDKVMIHEPTRHAQDQEVKVGNVTFKTHDMGGHMAARRLWTDYFTAIDGIVFLVDTTDHERFPEAKQELVKLLEEDALSKTPFVILGNKIDAKNAVSEMQLKQVLDLHQTTGKTVTSVEEGVRPIEVFMCSVVKRFGYADGFKWISNFIK